MAINKSEQTLEDKLINDIENLRQQMLTLKTGSQPIGADMLSVVTHGSDSLGPVNLLTGEAVTITHTINPTTDLVLTLFNFEVTAYVDVQDSNHKYPNGASLTSAQANMRFEVWMDWEDSFSDIAHSFIRAYKMRIVNLDAGAHDYYVNMLDISPKFTTA